MIRNILLILLVFASHLSLSQPLEEGVIAPEFIRIGHDGQEISIRDIESKVIILDFWASWCKPCIKSVQTTLKPLYESYSRSDLEIIGISNDKKEDSWRNAIDKWGLTWKNLWDEDRSLIRAYRIPAIPTYYIVNNKGQILASNVYSSQLKKEVKIALAQVN